MKTIFPIVVAFAFLAGDITTETSANTKPAECKNPSCTCRDVCECRECAELERCFQEPIYVSLSGDCAGGSCSLRPVAQRLAGNSDLPRPGKRLIGLVKRILGR